MNKLEEYKINSAVDCAIRVKNIAHRAGVLVGYDEGFDAAIALDLPVKFVEFLEGGQCQSFRGFWTLKTDPDNWRTTKDFYQYWIDNIYKPE